VAIDKALRTPDVVYRDEPSLRSVELPEEPSPDENSEVSVEHTEDGGAIVSLDPSEDEEGGAGFYDNFAEELDERDAGAIASKVVNDFQEDCNSRADWAKTYIKGLDVLGIKFEERTEPWPGACGAVHPLMAESAVRFQSQMISEIFQPEGSVKSKIVGVATDEKQEQGQRVADYVNYILNEKVDGYKEEYEKLLWYAPLAGSAFKKVYWNDAESLPAIDFIPSEDLLVPYGTKSLKTAERITHVIRLAKNEIQRLQASGFYSDDELSSPVIFQEDIQRKYSTLTGHKDLSFDGRYTLLECHCYLEDIEDEFVEGDYPVPYVVTVDYSSNKILSIRRNWNQGDETMLKREHFVHFQNIPAFGFYGLGLTHLLGGIALSTTSILRQLVDAGTLANLPGGFKSRGFKVSGDDDPIAPGEWREIDVPAGSIKDNLYTLPSKEPSGILFQLMQNMVQEGREFASLNDLQASAMNQQAPVGTTMAILEKSMQVVSAIQKRIHKAMSQEIKLIVGLLKENVTGPYPYEVGNPSATIEMDLDDRVDVIPVADPTMSTQSQRIMRYQAALQLAASKPEIYDMERLHKQMLYSLGIESPNDIIPGKKKPKPLDPISENMDILMGKPVASFSWQDHESHIKAHMSMAEDPQVQGLMGKSPNVKNVMAAMAAHVTEHLAYAYRAKIEQQLGTPLPELDKPIPGNVEIQLSKLVAEAAEMVLADSKAKVEGEKRAKDQEDPVLQMQKEELDIKRKHEDNIKAANDAKIQLEMAKLQKDAITSSAKMISDDEIKRIESAIDLLKVMVDAENNSVGLQSRHSIESAKLGVEAITKMVGEMKNANKTE